MKLLILKTAIIATIILCCSIISYPQTFNPITLFNESKRAVLEITTYDKALNKLSYGTGFFIDSNGVVITNYHVIKDAHHVDIRTFDGRTFYIKDILFADEDFDIVKFTILNPLKVQFKYLEFSKNRADVGEEVYVIGNPEGLEYSMSTGVVSSIRNNITNGKKIELIQTTAPISHGNSGSPLINKQGKAIGIISFTLAVGQNLNFAVSFKDIINKVSDQHLVLPLDKEKSNSKFDEFELELEANDGVYNPKDNIAVFMGLDKEIIKSFYRDWQIVQNAKECFGVAHESLGVYNYYFYESPNHCDGESYSIDKGKSTEIFLQQLLTEGYVKAKSVSEDGTQKYFTKYYVIAISPDPDQNNKNFISIHWNPNYHKIHK